MRVSYLRRRELATHLVMCRSLHTRHQSRMILVLRDGDAFVATCLLLTIQYCIR
jgi:hypothetical protein